MDMFCLYKLQIILFGLILVPVLTTSQSPECVEEHQLEKRAQRKLQHFHQPEDDIASAHDPTTPKICPLGLYQSMQISNRSLSPWRYIINTQEDRFPRQIAVAQCLCNGCIMINGNDSRVENNGYNSVPIKQSRVVLRKELCEGGKDKLYRLVPERVDVAIGCTCVTPKVKEKKL